MLPEVVGHVSMYLHLAQTPEGKNNKRPLQSARCVTTLKRAGTILTYAHIPSPHCVNGANPTAMRSRLHYRNWHLSPAFGCAVCTVMAANRKTRQNNSVTSRQYGRRAVYVPGDVRFQDGDAFDLGKLGRGTFTFIFFYCYSMSAFALAYLAITYTYKTTVVLWYNGLCGIRVLFVHDANQCAWRRLLPNTD